MLVSCIGQKDLFCAEVVLDLAAVPHEFDERAVLLKRGFQVIEYGDPRQIGLPFPQAEEVIARALWEVGRDIIHERAIQRGDGAMVEPFGESFQDRQIASPFEVQDPAVLLRLVILVPADCGEGFEDLSAAVVHGVGLANEGNDYSATSGFRENDLGVAGRNNLRSLVGGDLGQ